MRYVLLGCVLVLAWKWGSGMGKPNREWLEKRIAYERLEQRRRTIQHRYDEAAARGKMIDELLDKWLLAWLEQLAERS